MTRELKVRDNRLLDNILKIKYEEETIRELEVSIKSTKDKLISECFHPFIVLRPDSELQIMGITMLESAKELCLVCGKTYTVGSDEDFISLELTKNNPHFYWYCFLFKENGEYELDFKIHKSLVQSEMIINSLEQLSEYIKLYPTNDSTNDEQRMIEFVRFCNYQAEIASINTPGHESLSDEAKKEFAK